MAAVGAHDFGDVVPLEDVVLARVVAEAALVRLPAAQKNTFIGQPKEESRKRSMLHYVEKNLCN